MTYLELVNKVMRRIREPTVASVNENAYSRLVGEFINDAKRVVEDSWGWRALIDRVTITTTAGIRSTNLYDFNCTISGARPRENARLYIEPESSVALVRCITDDEESFLNQQNRAYRFVERTADDNDSVTGKPTDFYLETVATPVDGQTNIRVSLDPIPDATYSIQFHIVNPQNDLVGDTEVLLVPTFPVIQLAYLYTLYERGEEIGENLTLTSEKFKAALSDAIALDSSGTSNLIFTPG